MIPTVHDIAALRIDRLPPAVRVEPVARPFDVDIRPPGSKSIANRALLLAALTHSPTELHGLPAEADDVAAMIEGVRTLGAHLSLHADADDAGNAEAVVIGVPRRWRRTPAPERALDVVIDARGSGTTARFLLAASMLAEPEHFASITIDGDARMRERPIGELSDALAAIGECVVSDHAGSMPRRTLPLTIVPPDSLNEIGSEVEVAAERSGQTVSALLMIGAFLPNGLTIHMRREPATPGYVELTVRMLRQWGIEVDRVGRDGYRVPWLQCVPGASLERLVPFEQISPAWFSDESRRQAMSRHALPVSMRRYDVEPDASAAVPLRIAAALVRGSRIRFIGLNAADSAQPDAAVLHRIESGERLAGSVDLVDAPDSAMALAVMAAFGAGPAELRGLRTLRHKESDRIAALIAELSKIGVRAEAFTHTRADGSPDEGLRLTPPTDGIDCSPSAPPVEFETYNDHRMAMAMAIIGLRRPNVIVKNPACVGKTYPRFWRDYAMLF